MPRLEYEASFSESESESDAAARRARGTRAGGPQAGQRLQPPSGVGWLGPAPPAPCAGSRPKRGPLCAKPCRTLLPTRQQQCAGRSASTEELGQLTKQDRTGSSDRSISSHRILAAGRERTERGGKIWDQRWRPDHKAATTKGSRPALASPCPAPRQLSAQPQRPRNRPAAAAAAAAAGAPPAGAWPRQSSSEPISRRSRGCSGSS